MKKILDEYQEKILNFLDSKQNFLEEGTTLSDIAEFVWLDHPQKVSNKLQQLENKWFISKMANGIYRVIKKISNDTIYLPLYWFAQCWIKWPEIIEEYPKEYLPFFSKIIKNPNENYIAVKAKWRSMEPKISSWDIIIVKIQNNFEPSDLVLLSHNNEAKIKQIKEKDWKYYLHSLNNKFEDMEIMDKGEIMIIWIVKHIQKNV